MSLASDKVGPTPLLSNGVLIADEDDEDDEDDKVDCSLLKHCNIEKALYKASSASTEEPVRVCIRQTCNIR